MHTKHDETWSRSMKRSSRPVLHRPASS
jgi:hypothetical protein